MKRARKKGRPSSVMSVSVAKSVESASEPSPSILASCHWNFGRQNLAESALSEELGRRFFLNDCLTAG
jgi:hypothetical protein